MGIRYFHRLILSTVPPPLRSNTCWSDRTFVLWQTITLIVLNGCVRDRSTNTKTLARKMEKSTSSVQNKNITMSFTSNTTHFNLKIISREKLPRLQPHTHTISLYIPSTKLKSKSSPQHHTLITTHQPSPGEKQTEFLHPILQSVTFYFQPDQTSQPTNPPVYVCIHDAVTILKPLHP